jgi:hypothetical protein
MSEKYVSKAAILEWCKIQVPNMVLGDIPNHIMNMGHVKTDGELIRLGIISIPTKNDTNNFLKMAASSIILALLARARVIVQASGELDTDKFGEVTYKYHRVNPMFFFATGGTKPFMELLPEETLRMLFYTYLRAYMQWDFTQTYGRPWAKPVVVHDLSSRGAYWNISEDDVDVDDSLYGNIVDESDWLI